MGWLREKMTKGPTISLIFVAALAVYLLIVSNRSVFDRKYFGSAHCSLVSSHGYNVCEFNKANPSKYSFEKTTKDYYSPHSYIRAEFYAGSVDFAKQACELVRNNREVTPTFWTNNGECGGPANEWTNVCLCDDSRT